MGRIRESGAEHFTENSEKCGGYGDALREDAVRLAFDAQGLGRGED